MSNLSYSQYPVVKKIGSDSVVLITLKQGNDINRQFTVLNDSIKQLNDYIAIAKFDFNKYQVESENKYQQLNLTTIKYKSEADSIRFMYNQNKKIYKKHEDWWNRDRQHYMTLSLILMFTTIFFAAL
jgi:hypothetical protein